MIILNKMKSLLFFLLVVNLSVAQNWNYLGFYPGEGRHHPITFSSDEYGYIIAGQTGEGSYLNDVYRYNFQDGNWMQLSNFPGDSRGYAYGVSNNTFAYLGFGSNENGYLNDLWRYDMANDIWVELSSLPDIGRNHPAMILCGNKIYVGMGSVDSDNLGDWWEYDIDSDIWSQKTDFPYGNRHHPFYFSIDNIPFVGFGHGNSVNNNIVIYNDFYKYDVNTDSWIQLNNFPSEGRVAGTQFSFDGKGYVLSGDGDDHGPLDSGELWEYNPELDSWLQLSSHPGGARWAPGSFVINCNVFLTSGFEAESGIYYNDLLSYTLSDECGCNEEGAINFDSTVTINDNSCCYIDGCTDPNSINYDILACHDDGSCIPIILGCDLPIAVNYDSLSNTSNAYAGPNYISLGPGGYHYNDMWDMVFNCYQDVVIKSVDLYAETAFSTQIEILNLENEQIFNLDITLQSGLNQVALDFYIEQGNNYKIGISGENSGLYRNSSVENENFPINLLNVISIISNTTDSPLDYYYYFYNWQLEVECDIIDGCIDEFACNYNEYAIEDDGSCIYPAEFYDCQANCLNDLDNDLICDELDNCPDEYNPNQEDYNFDSIGDACDNVEINQELMNKKIIKVIDILGRNIVCDSKNQLLLYLYDDGTKEKKYFMK